MANTSEPTGSVSEIFDPTAWSDVDGFEFTDITYHRAVDAEQRARELGWDPTGRSK